MREKYRGRSSVASVMASRRCLSRDGGWPAGSKLTAEEELRDEEQRARAAHHRRVHDPERRARHLVVQRAELAHEEVLGREMQVVEADDGADDRLRRRARIQRKAD